MKSVQETIQAARAFVAEDPDPGTLGELQDLIEQAAEGDPASVAELADRFSGPLEFGTAGLRGRVEAGIARMNRLVVIKATWGLASHLLAEDAALARSRGVVVAFDARHSSRQFAEDAAAVLAGLRVPALIFPDAVPTPLCAFAVRLAVRAQRTPVQTGAEGLRGEIGTVADALDPDGKVFVHGELWDARCDEGADPGATVRVDAIDGLTLVVSAQA